MYGSYYTRRTKPRQEEIRFKYNKKCSFIPIFAIQTRFLHLSDAKNSKNVLMLLFFGQICIVIGRKGGVIMKKWRKKIQRYMLRPFIHMTFTRFILALAAILLADFFLSPHVGRSLKSPLFVLGGALFALLAWIARLRLDGVRLPRLLMLRVNHRKKPTRMYGDMIDYVDEQPTVAFEDLEDDEKDLCLLGADLVCCALLLGASLIA